MNKNNTTETTLNNVRSLCAERDCKERDRLRASRLEIKKEKKQKGEDCRIQTAS